MSSKHLALAMGLCVAVSACAEPPSAQVSVQVIIDNSAVLAQPQKAQVYAKRLFYHLSQLRKHRNTHDALIQLVSTNYPRNLWVGTPLRLRAQGKEVLERLQVVENGCADLRGAFEQVRMNLRRQKAEEVRVFVFSSLIDTGSPCTGEVEIRLPQAPPNELDLSFLDETVSTLKFLWVHPLQVGPWLDFLESKSPGSGAKNFGVYDEQETQTMLEKSL